MVARKSKNDVHAHGCTRCHQWYEDTCENLLSDAVCAHCRTSKGFELLRANRLPRDCCRTHSRLARKDEAGRYKLTGPGPWYLCPVCYRTHPHRDPTRSAA